MSSHPDIWKCPDCGECLDISALGFYTEVRCPSCARSAIVHTQLANFKLEGVLGVGGMSVVLRATDLILNRPLAIKVLNETYRDKPERIARFERECAMMARVRHENVVSVYSAGWARDQFYIAMELINGRNLETFVSEGKGLAPKRALEITREIILGLQAAHKAGMLHRDMKPGNVIISEDGKAKVLDFGLSLDTKTEDIEEVIWATPYYVPPETLERAPEDVRTDIYALGMTLRFLLTGEHELPGNQSSLSDLVKAKRHLTPFAQIAPSIDPAIAAMVDRMTAFKPSDRPASYTGLLQELDSARNVLQEKDEAKDPAQVRKRRQFIAAVAAGTLFCGAAGAALTAYLSIPAPTQDRLECPPAMDSGDLGRVQAVPRVFKSQDWKSTLEDLEALSESANEATLGAVSSLLMAYHASAVACNGDVQKYLDRFQGHIARNKKASAAAVPLFAQLQQMAPLLAAAEPVEDAGQVERPELRGMLHGIMAWKFAAQGRQEQAQAACRKAQEEFAKVPGRLRGFGTGLDTLPQRLEAGVRSGNEHQALASLAKHDFDAATKQLQAQMAVVPASQHRRIAALLEICQVGKAAVDVLQKRKPDLYQAGMSADKMKEAAAGIASAAWAEEVYTLGLLLSGDHAAAFEANPYRNDPASPNPFAVLMRGWQSALQAGQAPAAK